MENKPIADQERQTILYFPQDGVHSPELLFFEEKVVLSSWKRASEKGRRLWQRLREAYEHFSVDLFAPDRFVRRLAYFKKIRVLLTQPIDPLELKLRLKAIVRDRSYHHLRWLIVDSILLPLSLLAVPLPGPNVIGYYLVLRVFSHWKAYRSASKADLESVDIQISQEASEVKSLLRRSKDIKTALQDLREEYGLRALQEEKFIPHSAVLKQFWHRFREKPGAGSTAKAPRHQEF